MKNYFKGLSVFTMLILITLSSCKKEETTTTKSATDYLTAGNWKVTGITANPGINTGTEVITDIYSLLLDDCDKDDLTIFNANGTITDDQGAVKCDPESDQTTTDGTWALSGNDTALTLSYPADGGPVVMTIVTLNGTNLVVTYQVTEDFGQGNTTQTLTTSLTLQ